MPNMLTTDMYDGFYGSPLTGTLQHKRLLDTLWLDVLSLYLPPATTTAVRYPGFHDSPLYTVRLELLQLLSGVSSIPEAVSALGERERERERERSLVVFSTPFAAR